MSRSPVDGNPTRSASGFYASLVEGYADPVISVDADGAVLYANPAAEAMLGYDTEALSGRSLATLLPDERANGRLHPLRDRLSTPDRLTDAGNVTVPFEAVDGETKLFAARFHDHEVDGTRVYTGTFRGLRRNDRRRTAEEGDRSESAGDRSDEEDAHDLRTFRNLVEHAGHAIYVTDTDGTIEYVNPAFTEHTGYTAEDAIGDTPAILKSGEMPEEYYDLLWETVTAGEVWEEEIVDRRKDGSLYHAHQTIAPVLDTSGTVSQFVAIQTDVTERKQTEGRLKQYRDIVERLDDPILLQDRDGTFELLNDAVSEFAGLPRERLYGGDESIFMDEETTAEIDERRREVLEREEVSEYTVSPEFPQSDKEATFSTRRYPYYDAEGELRGTFAICRDITALKAREATLEQYERAINGATDLIAAVNRDGQFLFANPQYRAYHDIDDEDLQGLTLADVIDGGQYPDTRRYMQRALRGQTVEYRTTRTHPSRGTRTFDVRYYPLENPDEGGTHGVVGVLRDVTDRENRARQLSVVDRVLQHNLRNALTVIRGRAEQLVEHDPYRSGGIDIADAASYIVDRADDLLTTSEKAHHITEMLGDSPETEPIDLARVVARHAAAMDEEYPRATLVVSTPDGTSVTGSATEWIDRAFDELLRNAIEHHDRDRPTVEVTVRSTADEVHVTVADDGPGMTEMNRDVLETGRAVDALYHGSGLGLWLVYWVIQQSGGSASVAEREPRGTAVTITLPKATENR
ncbi:PAS domain S-box protein [Halorubrum sp. DTA46]|uniref:PAS domain S-box protein n=1 Tax=Halorubrum sp. DTA46 TaxID=3402162 RepID=UPI003AAD92FF